MITYSWLKPDTPAREINKRVRGDLLNSQLRIITPQKAIESSDMIYNRTFAIKEIDGTSYELWINGKKTEQYKFDSFKDHVLRKMFEIVHDTQRDMRQPIDIQTSVTRDFFKNQ